MTILVAAAAYSQCGGKNGIPRLPGDGNSETSKSFRVWHLISDWQRGGNRSRRIRVRVDHFHQKPMSWYRDIMTMLFLLLSLSLNKLVSVLVWIWVRTVFEWWFGSTLVSEQISAKIFRLSIKTIHHQPEHIMLFTWRSVSFRREEELCTHHSPRFRHCSHSGKLSD